MRSEWSVRRAEQNVGRKFKQIENWIFRFDIFIFSIPFHLLFASHHVVDDDAFLLFCCSNDFRDESQNLP